MTNPGGNPKKPRQNRLPTARNVIELRAAEIGDQGSRTFFGCDPFDRSNQAGEFFKKLGKPDERIVDVIRRKDTRNRWERKWRRPASITGATSAITCVRRGLPIAAVIFNHITEKMTVACPAGIFHVALPLDLDEDVTLDYVLHHGENNVARLSFPQPAHHKPQPIVTFAGKPGRGYPDNLKNCKLLADTDFDKHLLAMSSRKGTRASGEKGAT